MKNSTASVTSQYEIEPLLSKLYQEVRTTSPLYPIPGRPIY